MRTRRRFSVEHRQKLSLAHMGMKASSEARRKMSESRKRGLVAGTIRTWNKNLKGIHLSPATEFKAGQWLDEEHPNWKGDRAGYVSLHSWVVRRLGKPSLCAHCGNSDRKRYVWANVSKEYKRELNDWVRLCVSCHISFDRGHKQRVWDMRPGKVFRRIDYV